MDLQTLTILFAATLSSEPNARMAAELQIRKFGSETGMIAALLQIIARDDVEIDTRHACSVWLNTRVTANYAVQPATRRPHQIFIASSDRDALKETYDYPEHWPGLLDAIKQLLVSNNITHVHAGFREDGELLANIVALLFPTLVGIAGQMMQTPPSTAQAEVPAMLHLVVKTYRTSITIRLSPHQQSTWQSLVPWGQLLSSTSPPTSSLRMGRSASEANGSATRPNSGYPSDEDLDDGQDRMFNMKDDDEDVWDGCATILQGYADDIARLHADSDPAKPKSRRDNQSLYVLNKLNWAR
ncbi:hypothetical protein C8R47DRAFT_1193076 [Mycena vitilis]|nr:hypothetical protein C8R47DRAFT_1193076 [Mycena vitilis]